MLYFLIKQSCLGRAFRRPYLYDRRVVRKVSFGNSEADEACKYKFFALNQSSHKDTDS